MKIAVASVGKEKDNLVDPRFGRCAFFQIFNEEIEVVNNQAQSARRGAGVSAAQILADKNVEVVLAGNYGPNALRALSQAGIKTFVVDLQTSVGKALKLFKLGKLEGVSNGQKQT